MLIPLGAATLAGSRLIRRQVAAGPVAAGAALGLGAFLVHNLADFSGLLPSTLWTAMAVAGVLMGTETTESADAPSPAGRWWRWQLATAVPALMLFLAGMLNARAEQSMQRAQHLLSTGEALQALQASRYASSLAPWQAAPFLMQSEILLRQPELAPGVAGLQSWQQAAKAVRRSPRWPSAHATRGLAALRLGQPGLAAADLQRAAELYPLAESYPGQLEALARKLAMLPEGRP